MPPRTGSLFLLIFTILGCSWTSNAQLPTDDVQGYVYLEPFEARKEFAFYVRALEGWQERAAEEGAMLEPADQERILTEWRNRLPDLCALKLDGVRVRPTLDRIHFARNMDELGVLPDERERIPLNEALVAAVFAMPLEKFPSEVELTWDLFPGDTTEVPVYFTAPDAMVKRLYSPRNPVQSWQVPPPESIPSLLRVPSPSSSEPVRVPVLSLCLVLLGLACGVIARRMKKPPPVLGMVAAASLVMGLIAWNTGAVQVRNPLAETETIDEENAHTVVYPLLRNIYHAFDFRDESRLYDTLARSVDGDLLERVYLEIRRGLELENQGGPRVKVNNVDLREAWAEPLTGAEGFRSEAEWRTLGTVTHWGHTHQRVNVYRAWLTVQPVDDEWRLTNVEIIEEGRLN